MYCYYYFLPCNASGICYCHVLLVLLNMMAGTLLWWLGHFYDGWEFFLLIMMVGIFLWWLGLLIWMDCMNLYAGNLNECPFSAEMLIYFCFMQKCALPMSKKQHRSCQIFFVNYCINS
jgi:hypothetical protein